jgi:hypothetical protein
MALEYGKKNGLHVVTICPGLVFGPLLQHVAVNTSSKVLLYIIKGSHHSEFYTLLLIFYQDTTNFESCSTDNNLKLNRAMFIISLLIS